MGFMLERTRTLRTSTDDSKFQIPGANARAPPLRHLLGLVQLPLDPFLSHPGFLAACTCRCIALTAKI